MIFPSLPFTIGGLTFERKAFKVANELVTFFVFHFVSHWNYDPLKIIKTRLIANGNSARKYQHQETSLIEKVKKNKDLWDEVKKEMEKHATENKKLDIEVYKFDKKTQKKLETPIPVYEWTHKMRMIANNNNYNYFVDLFWLLFTKKS